MFYYYKNSYEYNVYDTLDFIYKYCKTIFNKLNKVMISKSSLVFYDVTNLYFEKESQNNEIPFLLKQ